MSGTRGGGRVSGHSVITLMHRPPSISSPHLRLRILATTTPARLSLPLPLSLSFLSKRRKPNRIDPLDDRSNQWDKEARRSVCVQIVTVGALPPLSRHRQWELFTNSPRIFVASLGPDTHLEKKFQRKNSTPFLFSSFLLSKEPTDSPYE